jgi:hypothetical protein
MACGICGKIHAPGPCPILQQKNPPPPVPQRDLPQHLKPQLLVPQKNFLQQKNPPPPVPQQNLPQHLKPQPLVPQKNFMQQKNPPPPVPQRNLLQHLKPQPPVPQKNLLQQNQLLRQQASGKPHQGPFTMVLYRSETRNHPSWKVRVKEGISVWKPWIVDDGKMDMLKLFNLVKQDMKSLYIKKQAKGASLYDKNIVDQQFVNGVLDAYAEYLTRESPKTSVAFARDPKAAYDLDFDYIVHVKNVYTFCWGPNLAIGKPAPFSEIPVDAHYIVLNSPTLINSTILAFGQKNAKFSGFSEVDFFTTAKDVVSCKCVQLQHPDYGKILYQKI